MPKWVSLICGTLKARRAYLSAAPATLILSLASCVVSYAPAVSNLKSAIGSCSATPATPTSDRLLEQLSHAGAAASSAERRRSLVYDTYVWCAAFPGPTTRRRRRALAFLVDYNNGGRAPEFESCRPLAVELVVAIVAAIPIVGTLQSRAVDEADLFLSVGLSASHDCVDQ